MASNDEFNDGIKAIAEGVVKGTGAKMPPVYPDLLQPTVRQFGITLGLVAGAVNIALRSVGASIFGYDQMLWFEEEITGRMANVAPENIQKPKGSIAGPIIEQVRFLADEIELRKLFAQLMATSMDKATATLAHPGFIEIIKNMSAQDAHLLKYIHQNNELPFYDGILKNLDAGSEGKIAHLFSKYEIDFPQVEKGGISSVQNLLRLGLIRLLEGVSLDFSVYEDIQQGTSYQKAINLSVHPNIHQLEARVYDIDTFGRQFCNACL